MSRPYVLPAAVYYVRFMWHGVRRLWPGGDWTLWQAIRAIHYECTCMFDREPFELLVDLGNPEWDCDECLSYWENDE